MNGELLVIPVAVICFSLIMYFIYKESKKIFKDDSLAVIDKEKTQK